MPEPELSDPFVEKPNSVGRAPQSVKTTPATGGLWGRPWVWLLALVVLGVALLGSARFLGLTPTAADDNDAAPLSPSAGDVFCFGLVDYEYGTLALTPLQPGRVAEVLVKEKDRVADGAVLLRLEDRRARARVAAARAAVKVAELLVPPAKRKPRQFQTQLAQQQAAVEAAGSRLSAARHSLDRKRSLSGQNLASQDEVSIAEAQVKELEAMQRAQQARLSELRTQDPLAEVSRAEAGLAQASANLKLARQDLDDCQLKAPRAGVVLRLSVSRGDVIGGAGKQTPLLFGPNTPLLIRAEIDQEFASGVVEGQAATAEDDTQPGRVWTGQVKSVSNWFLTRREILDEIMQTRETRTLECQIALDPDQPPLRLGQRMRVTIKRGASVSP